MYTQEKNNKNEFNEWLHSDNVIKSKDGYRCQCNLYKFLFKSIEEIHAYFKKEYRQN